jgi:phosphate transport system substrate-binding protein
MIKRVLTSLTAGLAMSVAALSVQAADITGAGATFPYPIFAKWAEVYKKIENVNLNRHLRCLGCACCRSTA